MNDQTRKQHPFLPRQLRKVRFLFGVILLLVLASFVFFYDRTLQLTQYISSVVTSRTEAAVSEHNNFQNTLLVELIKEYRKKKSSSHDDELPIRLKAELETFQEHIGTISLKKTVKGTVSSSFNLDKIDYKDIPGVLYDEVLEKLTAEQLNLKCHEREFYKKDNTLLFKGYTICNRSTAKVKPFTFVFIPTHLALFPDQTNRDVKCEEYKLDTSLKKDLVFSRIVEEHIIKTCKKYPEIVQGYYISLKGFIRIYRKGKTDPVKHYLDKFSLLHSFSDRTYFSPTLEVGFRPSSPYVDIGGLGIVQTYSVPVLHKEMGIIGIIGIDRKIGELKDLKPSLKRLSLGAFIPGFKNFWLDFINKEKLSQISLKDMSDENIIREMSKSGEINNLLDSEKLTLGEFFKNMPTALSTKVNRFDSEKGTRTIFTLPFEKEIALMIFDKEKLMRNKIIFLTLLVAVTIAIFTLIIGFYYQSLKRIEAAKSQLELLSQMHHSYIITDKNNKILFCNEEFENLVDMKKPDGKRFDEFLTEDSARDFRISADGNSSHFETTIDIRSREKIIKPAVLISTQSEFPLKKSTRLSIIIESESLETMVAEKYIIQISHLLKTPLHSIHMLASQLRKTTLPPDRANEYYKILDAEIDSFKHSLGKILRLSKIEFKHVMPEFKKIDFSKLMKNISKEFESMGKKKRLHFECSIASGVSITADKNMIRAAIENLLDNAFKYTTKGSVTLKLTSTPAQVTIIVEDTGIGISKSEHEKIFKKGYRCDDEFVNKSEGKGYGLFQCKEFITLNSGQIFVESEKKKFTRFKVVLPKEQKPTREVTYVQDSNYRR